MFFQKTWIGYHSVMYRQNSGLNKLLIVYSYPSQGFSKQPLCKMFQSLPLSFYVVFHHQFLTYCDNKFTIKTVQQHQLQFKKSQYCCNNLESNSTQMVSTISNIQTPYLCLFQTYYIGYRISLYIIKVKPNNY